MMRTCSILGAAIESGASRLGCLAGPTGLRVAGMVSAIERLGWLVSDLGNASIKPQSPMQHENKFIHHLAETRAWIEALEPLAFDAAEQHDFQVFLGGDHSMSAGIVPGLASHAEACRRPLFVLWLDAHPDLHSLHSTRSGNLHGTPLAYFTGQDGFEAFPELKSKVNPRNVLMMGVRSIDPPELIRIGEAGFELHDMSSIRKIGIRTALSPFLNHVSQSNGLLHVSFDVDFLDPDIAPGVGTKVPDGATMREAHLIMETLCASGLVNSLDLVELNPSLDKHGRTASLLCDLVTTLLANHPVGQHRSYLSENKLGFSEPGVRIQS